MPPRKRARIIAATSPVEPPSQPKTPVSAASPSKPAEDDRFNDPWTDEEEIGLFKGLIKWKPTGMHKHFHLLALHRYLLENGYIHPKAEHTRPAGIWAKLGELYDLDALNQREDATAFDHLQPGSEVDNDEKQGEDAEDSWNFVLPDGHGYDEMQWQRRFKRNGEESHSPAEVPELDMKDEPLPVRFIPSFSTEPSEVPTPASRISRKGPTAKGGRGGTKGGPRGRGGAAASAVPRRSVRQAESVAEEEQGDEEGGAEGEEEDSSAPEEESEKSTPLPRGGRGRGGSRGGRGRGRGRPKR